MEPPTDEQIGQLKRQLLRKGSEINERLVAILSGKKVTMESLLVGLGGSGAKKESQEEKLRHFLDLVDGRIKAIAAGRYGRCERCGDGLPFEHLQQVPWIDTCQRCAATPETPD